MAPLTRRAVVAQATPMILANAVAPLAGVVDTAVMGVVGGSGELGGIALGATLFNLLYTTFYFLRMGSSGLAAQAVGAGDGPELQRVLLRGLLIAAVSGVVVLLLSGLLSGLGFGILQGSETVESVGAAYFGARVYGAPGTLASFVLTGWLIGRGRTRAVLGIAAGASLTNIALDVLLVMGLGYGVEGIGYATAAADSLGALLGLALVYRIIRQEGGLHASARQRTLLLSWAAIRRLTALNLDMMVRSWGLLAGFAWFVNASARHGDAVLSGNHVLLQVITVWSFVLDAFAFTAETGVGHAIGRRSLPALRRAVRLTSELALAAGVAATLLTLFAGPVLLSAWIGDAETLAAALTYLPYCALVPLLGVPAWQLDGIFIGATRSAAMRNASVVSVLVYLVVDHFLRSWPEATGLWSAFLVYYVARAVTLGVLYPRVESRVCGDEVVR